MNARQITAFCTGGPGSYFLKLYDGHLDEIGLEAASVRARLGIEVRQGILCFRDLYDFMQWEPDCPMEQTVAVPDGLHRITAYTSPPQSGILGDDQVVSLHFEAWPERPPLAWSSVPDLVAT